VKLVIAFGVSAQLALFSSRQCSIAKGSVMHINAARIIAAMLFAFFVHAASAAPGEPIGGIVVKGGKNPGGQMLVLTTTGADGSFTIEFAEGGEYRLVFEGKSRKQSAERVQAGMQLEYVVQARNKMTVSSKQHASSMSRHTPFHNKIENAQTIVVVPQGGGIVRGALQSLNSSDSGQAADRAINESGVSVKSPPPKGGIKR
jgi:hypothetical protein